MDSEIKKIKLYIKNNIQTRIRLRQVCNDLGMNYETIRKKFKRKEGISLKKYLSQQQLKRIERLIKTTKISISKIAQKFHFTDNSHFCRWFKKEKGILPSHYIRSIRSK